MKQLKKYFTIWWIPLISYVFPISIFYIALSLRNDLLVDMSIVVFMLNVVGNLISAIVQVVTKKWYFLFPQIIITLILYFLFLTYLALSNPDFYGANKTIPTNIEIYKPISEEIVEIDLTENDFILQQSFQPGVYNYFTSYKPKTLGTFYIKAYEITSNDRLSDERITNASSVVIQKMEDKSYSGKFTIYEGSWSDEYAARIELWFKPKNTSEEYKVSEKNYIVEGWMR